jgi:hypothetical protein
MSILSAATEQQVTNILVSENMLTADKLSEAKFACAKAGQSLLGYLVKNNIISEEQLTKANATVTYSRALHGCSARRNASQLGRSYARRR